MLQSLLLGLIQGLTEFLPVSSSGHLILLPKIFNLTDPGLAFDAFIHLGTLAALLLAFRKKSAEILGGVFGRGRSPDKNAKLAALIILSAIPVGLAGYFFNDYIEAHFRAKTIVAANLIFWGLVLWQADRFYKRRGAKIHDIYNVGIWRAIIAGLAQAIALIPGTSRSGITASAGLFTKMNRQTAVEFSFLISIPAVALAGFWELYQLFRAGFELANLTNLALGFFAAALSGFLSIRFLLAFVKHWGFGIFVLYRLALGAAILIML